MAACPIPTAPYLSICIYVYVRCPRWDPCTNIKLCVKPQLVKDTEVIEGQNFTIYYDVHNGPCGCAPPLFVPAVCIVY